VRPDDEESTMAAVSTQDLARIGLRMRPEDFEERVRAAIQGLRATPLALGAVDELPPGEAALLAEGGFSPRRIAEERGPYLDAITEYTALIATAQSVREVAKRLRIDPSQVRRRLGQRTLYGLKPDEDWLLPAFQFTAAGLPLPGLAVVLPQLPPDLNPVAVYRWFTLPDPDLRLDLLRTPGAGVGFAGETLSPHDWLAAGGDPAVVAALAAGLGQHG
jgi:hypothetical protein